MDLKNQSLDINALREAYQQGRFSPTDIIDEVQRRIDDMPEHNAWIRRLSRAEIEPYLERLEGKSPESMSLYGIPFAIKDNIDLAGVPTTAACPEYAYEPGASAFVVQCLLDAGAIPVGKTNLDQFATGLVGTRSPYGPGMNSFDPAYVSGGSSSGSAIAVAMGQVSFALGTDTAGSGRVTAAFNNLIGMKPTRGLFSNSGVVPACRSLDCVSILSYTAADAEAVFDICNSFDADDAFARPKAATEPVFDHRQFRFGVPPSEQLEFFGNAEARRLFDASVAKLKELGGEAVEVDLGPFLEAARLLYEGPWVTERYLAIESFITTQPEALHPVTRKIIGAGDQPSAMDAFRSGYRLQALRRESELAWQDVDVIVTPTAGTIYTIDEVEQDPVQLNSNLGYYTNFMNLLDLSACAVPAGMMNNGLPFGITLFGPAGLDRSLLRLADPLQRALSPKQGAMDLALPETTPSEGWSSDWMTIVVVGAHMQGLPLNHQLTERGGRFLERTQTSPDYRLYALPGGPPYRPGLVKVENGVPLEVELWALPMIDYGSFVAGIPEPLGIGTVTLADGRTIQGFLCEQIATLDATDISEFGGWRAYVSQLG